MGRVFANGPGDLGSFPGCVILKTFKKWYLIPPCLTLSIIRYVSRVKWSNPGKGVAPSPTPRCGGYWKGAFGSPSTKFANFTYRIYKQMFEENVIAYINSVSLILANKLARQNTVANVALKRGKLFEIIKRKRGWRERERERERERIFY